MDIDDYQRNARFRSAVRLKLLMEGRTVFRVWDRLMGFVDLQMVDGSWIRKGPDSCVNFAAEVLKMEVTSRVRRSVLRMEKEKFPREGMETSASVVFS